MGFWLDLTFSQLDLTCFQLYYILDSNGRFIERSMIQGDRKPLNFKYEELKKTLYDFVEFYSNKRLGMNACWLAKIRKSNNNYNIYGRIFTK